MTRPLIKSIRFVLSARGILITLKYPCGNDFDVRRNIDFHFIFSYESSAGCRHFFLQSTETCFGGQVLSPAGYTDYIHFACFSRWIRRGNRIRSLGSNDTTTLFTTVNASGKIPPLYPERHSVLFALFLRVTLRSLSICIHNYALTVSLNLGGWSLDRTTIKTPKIRL